MRIVGILNQKGGVSKSTIAQMISVNYAGAGWSVKIADMDIQQGTSTEWNAFRMRNDFQPSVNVQMFKTTQQALQQSQNSDVLVFDGSAQASPETLEIAKASHMVIIPTGMSAADLKPSVLLAHEFTKEGVPPKKIAFALARVGTSQAEINEAREYISKAGYLCLNGELYEKTAIRRASDMGLCATETPYKSVNEKCDILLQSIIDKLEILKNG